MILAVDASSGSAQGPPNRTSDVVFEQTKIENVREGYQAVRWELLERATRYEVVDADGRTFYSGDQNEAFISGLPDGEHTFVVRAFGDDGELIGSSGMPVVIVVEHWPIGQAWALLALGAVVFVVMIGSIIVGAAQTRSIEGMS